MGLEQSKEATCPSDRGHRDIDRAVRKYDDRSLSSHHRHIEYIAHSSPRRNPYTKWNHSYEHDTEFFVHVHFFSFGALKGRLTTELPVLSAIDLSDTVAPSALLCRWFTGRDPEIVEDFWSYPEHHKLYHETVLDVGYKLIHLLRSGRKTHVAVLVNCASGVHRSVVFMSRLYDEFKGWPAIKIIAIKATLWFLAIFVNFDSVTWDDKLVGGMDFLANSVLQVPFFLMSLMRYITPTLDHMFMDSLQWVDQTYIQKHKSEDPNTLRAMYYPNLRMYSTHGETSQHRAPMDAALAFLIRFGRRAGISLGIYMLSYLPVVGRFVLPAASFYTFNKAVGPVPATVIFGSGIFLPRRYLVVFLQSYFSSRSLMRELLEPYFSRVRFTPAQKRLWFRDREGLLFGFGVGFYIFLKIPLLGVLIYGIAEASTAYLITKITDPPPSPAHSEGFAESQVRWTNKHQFLSLPLANLDAHNADTGGEQQSSVGSGGLQGKKFS
ncbi:MAG: hypothetical protein Q9191_002864 [Dirinaria sp. TL-2023a]